MTRLPFQSSLPGRVLLKLATCIFDGAALETFVIPVLADLQREVQDAGDDSVKRLSARMHGYLAFWRVVMAISLTTPAWSHGGARTFFATRSGGNFLVVVGVALLVAISPLFGWFALGVILVGSVVAVALRQWNDRHAGLGQGFNPLVSLTALLPAAAISPTFGWFVVAAMAVGVVMAILLRRWNTHHPSVLAPARPLASLTIAEINLSSIPVAGDIGGLMFVVGSVLIVLLGLPDMRWFVLASVVSGGTLALALSWRSSRTAAPPALTIRGR